jgi:integrase
MTIKFDPEPDVAERLEMLCRITNLETGDLINNLLDSPLSQIIDDHDCGLLRPVLQSFEFDTKEEALAAIAGYDRFVSEDEGFHYSDDAKPARTRDGRWEILYSRALSRRSTGNLPMKLFQNSKGAWFASFTDQKGKRRFISLKTKDGKVAEQIAEQIVPHELARIREPIHKEVVRYLEEKAELRSPNWTWDGGCVLRAWAAEMMIEHDCSCVQEIDTFKLQKWFYAKARTVKVSTAAAYLFWIKPFLKWCMEERHLVFYNAADQVKVPRHTKAVRRNFLTQRDAESLIDHCTDQELRVALFCAIHAGFRRCEVDMARPEWFDLDHRLIHIQISSTWQTKNGEPRTVPMTEEFHDFLEVYGLRSPFMIAPEKERAGKWRYRFDLERRFEKLTMVLGVQCTFHDLRRTFASLKVSAGVSIYKVARWCGHRVEIAERHYGHLVPADDEINIGLERRAPAPEVAAIEIPAHRQLTWEEVRELVWSKPLTRAARGIGITDNGLKKMCNRLKVPLPPQGYWQTPPANRAKFLERANRSHAKPEEIAA